MAFRAMMVTIFLLFAVLAYTNEVSAVCPCPKIYAPVCGSNGKTFTNECELKCEARSDSGLSLRHTGACTEAKDVKSREAPQCACPMNFSPLCGSDGQTYSNQCTFDCEARVKADLKVIHDGPCAEEVESLLI